MTNNISKEFTKELKALLAKYDVELSLEDMNRYGYYPNYHIVAEAYAQWDKDGNMIREPIDVDFGSFIDGK